jgi:hypothetical protein
MKKEEDVLGKGVRRVLHHFAPHKGTHQPKSMMHEGQINRGSRFGEIIYSLAKDPQFHTFLEIGTWNGQGSTRCFIDGLLERDDEYVFISLENDRKLQGAATQYWKDKIDDRIQLLYGTVVRPEEIMKEEEVRAHPLFVTQTVKDHYHLYYRSDVENSRSAPLVLERIPSQIDVLLLDGGEFSGYAEWSKLRDRKLRVVLLDDINTMKNDIVFGELRQDSRWNLVLQERGDRNGFALFARQGEPISHQLF